MVSNAALSLNPDNHSDVIAFMRKTFSDYIEFDEFIREPLADLLRNFRIVGVTADSTSRMLSNYLRPHQDDKKRADQLKTVLTACQVLLLTLLEGSSFIWSDVETLLQHYEEFRAVEDAKELQLLLHYRNFMAAALRLLPARGNKIFFVRVMERLEGGDQVYITGTGQKAAVTRRIKIYEKEGKVEARRTENPFFKKRRTDHSSPSQTPSPSHSTTFADDDIAAPFDSAHQFASVSLPPPPPPALPAVSAGPPSFPATRQFSEVATGELSLDAKSHNTLLFEPYKGSFTEVIEGANIS